MLLSKKRIDPNFVPAPIGYHPVLYPLQPPVAHQLEYVVDIDHQSARYGRYIYPHTLLIAVAAATIVNEHLEVVHVVLEEHGEECRVRALAGADGDVRLRAWWVLVTHHTQAFPTHHLL